MDLDKERTAVFIMLQEIYITSMAKEEAEK
jgi:hypothetical protein